eukprot:7734740-Pyramimonas_sp.AAC.1
MAANTLYPAGPTYYGAHSHSRVDFVHVTQGLRRYIHTCKVLGWLTTPGSLQVEKTKRLQTGRKGLGLISNFLVHHATTSIKRRSIIAFVHSALLSGMEGGIPDNTYTYDCDKIVMRAMRRGL